MVIIITVKELIEALSKFDGNAKVRVYEEQPHVYPGGGRSGVVIRDHDDKTQIGLVQTRNSY